MAVSTPASSSSATQDAVRPPGRRGEGRAGDGRRGPVDAHRDPPLGGEGRPEGPAVADEHPHDVAAVREPAELDRDQPPSGRRHGRAAREPLAAVAPVGGGVDVDLGGAEAQGALEVVGRGQVQVERPHPGSGDVVQLDRRRRRVHDDVVGRGRGAHVARRRRRRRRARRGCRPASRRRPAPRAVPARTRPASVSHAPAVEPSPAALTCAWLGPGPLASSATDQLRPAPPPAVAAAARPLRRGRRAVEVDRRRRRPRRRCRRRPPRPRPGATPSPMPSRGSCTEWSPTPGAPAQRTWPATETAAGRRSRRCRSCRRRSSRPGRRSRRRRSSRGVRYRSTTEGGATSRTSTRGLSMK